MSELDDFRSAKDAFFRDNSQSPLTPSQRVHFSGLRYFPEVAGMRLQLTLDPNVEHAAIEMDTSTGERQRHTRAAKIHFEVEGRQCVLYLYSRGRPERLFLPFRDTTSGKETYGAGRYLDLTVSPGGGLLVDFNYAYNPYCAYNDRWTCPIPPVENWLQVAIRAGELAFHADEAHAG
ncbi:MAG: DUF1684 domain-containing protein [Chloroflexi bacterium]|nr:DUF1684 domain-containing protein [Chloroflexota bacterium]